METLVQSKSKEQTGKSLARPPEAKPRFRSPALGQDSCGRLEQLFSFLPPLAPATGTARIFPTHFCPGIVYPCTQAHLKSQKTGEWGEFPVLFLSPVLLICSPSSLNCPPTAPGHCQEPPGPAGPDAAPALGTLVLWWAGTEPPGYLSAASVPGQG